MWFAAGRQVEVAPAGLSLRTSVRTRGGSSGAEVGAGEVLEHGDGAGQELLFRLRTAARHVHVAIMNVRGSASEGGVSTLREARVEVDHQAPRGDGDGDDGSDDNDDDNDDFIGHATLDLGAAPMDRKWKLDQWVPILDERGMDAGSCHLHVRWAPMMPADQGGGAGALAARHTGPARAEEPEPQPSHLLPEGGRQPVAAAIAVPQPTVGIRSWRPLWVFRAHDGALHAMHAVPPARADWLWVHGGIVRLLRRGVASGGAASVASFLAAVLTEMYLCNVCLVMKY
jgi:hypothetical protein